MIAWSAIRAEFDSIKAKEDTALAEFRQLKVELFLKHRGEETDEVVRGKPITVNAKSFAKEMRIPYATFLRWIHQFGVSTPESPAGMDDTKAPTCVNDGIPPKEGVLRPLIAQLRDYLPAIRAVSRHGGDAIRWLTEDVAEFRAILDEIEEALTQGKKV